MRTRFIYSKRNSACFTPHIALAQMFSRTATRAGLKLIMTQGFSPRAKISFAPELPAGVVALNEPVDMFFEDCNKENILPVMNAAIPEGFFISRVTFPAEDSPALGKICTHAEYLIRCLSGFNQLEDAAKNFFQKDLLSSSFLDNWLKILIKSPAQNPIGGFVRNLIQENFIAGWHEINIVRTKIGDQNLNLS